MALKHRAGRHLCHQRFQPIFRGYHLAFSSAYILVPCGFLDLMNLALFVHKVRDELVSKIAAAA